MASAGEMAPPPGVKLELPSHEVIRARIEERRRMYGGSTTMYSTTSGPDTPSSYDDLVIGVRNRRKLLQTPYVPTPYRSSQPPLRAGQAILGDVIQREASILSQGDRNLRVIPDDENSKKEQERAALLERWTRAAFLGRPGRPSRMTEEAGEDWFRLGMEAALGDGRAIWEFLPRADRWSNFAGHPDADQYQGEGGYKQFQKDRDKFLKSTAQFPFEINRVDTLTYFEVRRDKRIAEVLKVDRREKREIFPKYGIREGMDSQYEYGEAYPLKDLPPGLVGTCEVVSYWAAADEPRMKNIPGLGPRLVNDVVWVVEVDGHRVDCGYSIGPPWHPLPYFCFNGMDSSMPDPMHKGVSVAFRLMRICDAIDELINMKMIVARWASLPAWQKTTPEGGIFDLNTGAAGAAAATGSSGSSSGFMGSFALEMGRGYELYPGQKIEPVVWPQHTVTILESLKNDLTELSNLLGLPPIMRGDMPSAGAAGYLAAQLIAQAKTALAPVLDNATNCVSTMIKWLWWQVEHRFEEGVPIWWNGDSKGKGASWLWLKPELIDGRYDLTLELQPLLPVDKIQRQEASLNQVQAKAISMRRHREEGLGLEDPEEEEEQIATEEMLRNPMVAIPRMARAAVRMGYLTAEEATAVVRKELGLPDVSSAAGAAGFVLGPNGVPISSGGPPQGPIPPGMPLAAPTPTQSPVPGAGPDMLQVMGGGQLAPGMGLPIAPTAPNPQGLPGGLNIQGGVGIPRPGPDLASRAM